jgi:HSP20 family protein
MAGTLTRWDPFTEFADLRTRFDRMLGELTPNREHGWMPAIDVMRDETSIVVHADIPGYKPEEVRIEVEDDVLTLSGEHEESKEQKEKDFVRRERHYGSFARSMALPPGVKATEIKARTHDGVLEVTIPLPTETKHEPVQITPSAA